MEVVKSSSQKCSKNTQMWSLGTWLSGGPGNAWLMVGLCYLRSLFPTLRILWFCVEALNAISTGQFLIAGTCAAFNTPLQLFFSYDAFPWAIPLWFSPPSTTVHQHSRWGGGSRDQLKSGNCCSRYQNFELTTSKCLPIFFQNQLLLSFLLWLNEPTQFY